MKAIWKPQTVPFQDDLNDTLQQQHHATQFIALAGRHLIPRKADDSNTSLEFIFDGGLLRGNLLPNGMHLVLSLTDLMVTILDQDNHTKKSIVLEGKSKQTVFNELKQSLSELEVDVTGFKNELHYEIPLHPLDQGASFSVKDGHYLTETANYRNNADLIIREMASAYDQAEPVRIWPHHFDTGSIIPVSRSDAGGISQSIGIGWAIPDGMVKEPYYYLSFWSEKPVDNAAEPGQLIAGEWMLPNWNGAVLKHSAIIKENTAANQHQLVEDFFKSGISSLMKYLKP